MDKPEWIRVKAIGPKDRFWNPPPGLLLSLGDGTAVEANDEMIARELFNARQYNNPYGPPNWDEQPAAIQAVFLKRAAEFRARIIQQAQEARDAG